MVATCCPDDVAEQSQQEVPADQFGHPECKTFFRVSPNWENNTSLCAVRNVLCYLAPAARHDFPVLHDVGVLARQAAELGRLPIVIHHILLVLDNFRVGLEVVVLPAEVALHGVDRVGEDEGREARPLAQLHVRGFLRPAPDQLRANLLLLEKKLGLLVEITSSP